MEPSKEYLELPPFDELMALAQNDPEALTRLRHELCEQLITRSGANEVRLRALQSHIERKLGLAKNPLHASVLLSQELQRALYRLQDAILAPSEQEGAPSAKVLPFRSEKSPD